MAFTQVPPNSTGNKIDTVELTDGADTVQRQVIVMGDPDDVDGMLPIKSTMPEENDKYLPVRQMPAKVFRSSFAKAISNNVDTDNWTLLRTGTGQTVNQTGGNLVLTAGTTANQETIIRSLPTFNGGLILKWGALLSQRIINNNFIVELVDVVGDSLAFVINSAVSVTVTFPVGTNPFTAQNVGQSMQLGNITGAAGIPARYAIASVSGDTVTFTVAAWPASGSGTLSLFGWNYYQHIYTAAVATNMNFDAQRNGYASGATTATINTSASPGHIGIMSTSNGQVFLSDKLAAFTTIEANTASPRAVRDQNIPDSEVALYLQIRMLNGTTNPASNTTFTVNFVSVEDYTPNYFELAGLRNQAQALRVLFVNASALAITGTVSLSSTGVFGPAAHDAPISGQPVRIGARAVTANYAAVASGDAADLVTTVVGAQIVKPFSIPELDWQYAAAAGGISNTPTAVTIKAVAGAGIRNYITSIQVMAEALGAATELVIRDGAAGTVIWRTKIPVGGLPTEDIVFASPLKGTANTLLEVATLTASVTGAVFFNAQGYVAP